MSEIIVSGTMARYNTIFSTFIFFIMTDNVQRVGLLVTLEPNFN